MGKSGTLHKKFPEENTQIIMMLKNVIPVF
jgi:hypothetical protein